ncbi:MAG TPA: NADH-quinone oxidoreductase subunit A [Verrucomicrobiae bacterium]|nr:NADH-quinone oxidoreductase subunit A [Verrucomicrobiae bacterium]
MLDSFLPAMMLLGVAAAMAFGMIGISHLFGFVKNSRVKLNPYECGIPVVDTARKRASIRFYVVAMLFILFDIEAAFLYPWAVLFRRMGLFGFTEMLLFLGVLVVGYVYCWRRGGLEWE